MGDWPCPGSQPQAPLSHLFPPKVTLIWLLSPHSMSLFFERDINNILLCFFGICMQKHEVLSVLQKWAQSMELVLETFPTDLVSFLSKNYCCWKTQQKYTWIWNGIHSLFNFYNTVQFQSASIWSFWHWLAFWRISLIHSLLSWFCLYCLLHSSRDPRGKEKWGNSKEIYSPSWETLVNFQWKKYLKI